MLDSLFRGVFDTALTDVISPSSFLLCVVVSLMIGLLLCAMTLWRARCSGSFAVALALLPAVVGGYTGRRAEIGIIPGKRRRPDAAFG